MDEQCSHIQIYPIFLPFLFFFKFFIILAVMGLRCCMRASLVAARGAKGATLCCGVQDSLCGSFSYCQAQALGHKGFSSCSEWAQYLWLLGSRPKAQPSWRTGWADPRYVGCSSIRDRTCVPCIGRKILYHWASRAAPHSKKSQREERMRQKNHFK